MKKVGVGWSFEKFIVYSLSFIVLFTAVSVLHAEEIAVPAAINYQGMLTNPSDGAPVDAGVYHLEFRVWNDPVDTAEGNLIWGRTFSVHVMDNGVFNILLTDDGTEVTAPSAQTNDIRQAFQGENRYLGLTITHGPSGVINSPEISPRQRMVSSPFAFHAQNATDAYHAEHADEAVLAQDSEKLGGTLSNEYYDNDRFNSLGLSGSYKKFLGWGHGGIASSLGFYAYGGRYCISGVAVEPATDVKLLIRDGKLEVDQGVIAHGVITPAAGTDGGIDWAEGSDGGPGDQGWLRYHGTSGNGVLELGAGNDANDKVRIESSGNVEINAGGSLVLKNADKVEVLSTGYHVYSMEKWYKASGDGMVTFHGYKGHMDYWQQNENGHYLTANDGQEHWEHFFTVSGADTLTMTMPVAKGDRIRFGYGGDAPDHWHIRWRGFGDAILVEE